MHDDVFRMRVSCWVLDRSLDAGGAIDPREQLLHLELRLAHACVSGRGHASPLTAQAFSARSA